MSVPAITAVAALAALSFVRRRGSQKLEGFVRIGTLPRPSQVHPVSRGIYSPRAEDVYAERLKTARLPLYIVLGGGIDPADKLPLKNRAQHLADEGYTVLLLEMPIEKYLEEVAVVPGSSEEAQMEARKRGRAIVQSPRDRSRKISPMTPFTLLHRMGDEMRHESWSAHLMEDILHLHRNWIDGFLDDKYYQDDPPSTDKEKLIFGSVGVNTMAGRNGLLRIPETISDLWAKYVLTGRIDFDPEAKPEGRDWNQTEKMVRNDIYKGLHHSFPQLLDRARGKVIKVSSL